MKALKTAHQHNKTGKWWIKADATDVNKGLRESMNNKWSGDVDMGDGGLQKLYKEYLNQLSFIRGFGLKDRRSYGKLEKDIYYFTKLLEKDMETLKCGLESSKNQYNASLKRNNVAEQALFALAWDVEGYEKLLLTNGTLNETFKAFKHRVLTEEKERKGNFPKELKKFRDDFEVYCKGV
jgi:hypothetical protein